MHPITEHIAHTERHTSFYLACGAADATPLIFVHGWPELSISWRHQLPVFAALGFRCIAPDMRGYGRSSVYRRHEDYALEHSVRDMVELLDTLGPEKAVWVGHDWGSPVVWTLASHHPDRCFGVVNLCVPYLPGGFAPAETVPLVDRSVYPEAEFPAGQWEYQLFYEESFDQAGSAFEASVADTVKALFRKGTPAGKGQPSRAALVRRDGGWFGGAGRAPAVPRDADVLTEADLSGYVASLQRNGFFGPDSWYMNHARNMVYAQDARDNGRLSIPILFLHGAYDYTCETIDSRLAEPMREYCADLTEVVVQSGHWMAQENPVAVNAALARFLATKLAAVWGACLTGSHDIRIGVGGWTFEPWRGAFYPEKHPQKRELEFASRKLTSIEINGTYYGSQKPASFAKWHDETPDDFVFALKGPRFTTNRRVLAEAGSSIERFFASGVMELRDKLGPINWQFMPTKRFDPEDFAAFLKLLPKTIEGRPIRHAVEVRHASFRTPDFAALARDHGVAIIIAGDSDYPRLGDLTAPFVYARVMGTTEAESSGYSAAKLDEWAKQIREWGSGRDVFLYVISGFKRHNPAAAMALIERLK